MLKRTLIILSLTIAVVVAVELLQTVQAYPDWKRMAETYTVEPNAANAANVASR